MFLRREEWEEKCSTNRALLKDKEEKLKIIDILKEDNIKLDAQVSNLQHNEEIMKDRIEWLSQDNDILLKTNMKLTEWINKIINEVGIYEVQDRKTISIPIYRKIDSAILRDDSKIVPFMDKEEIIIPEIRFIKMR